METYTCKTGMYSAGKDIQEKVGAVLIFLFGTEDKIFKQCFPFVHSIQISLKQPTCLRMRVPRLIWRRERLLLVDFRGSTRCLDQPPRHLYSFVQIQTLIRNKKALQLSQSMNLSGEHNRKGKSVADRDGQEGKRAQQ